MIFFYEDRALCHQIITLFLCVPCGPLRSLRCWFSRS